jgi:hypothetical protein
VGELQTENCQADGGQLEAPRFQLSTMGLYYWEPSLTLGGTLSAQGNAPFDRVSRVHTGFEWMPT